MPRRLLLLTLALAALLVALPARAKGPIDPKEIPPSLEPWVSWALDGKAPCPFFQGHADMSRCAWPSRIDLSLDERAGRFSQRWHVEGARQTIPLAGDAKRWPQDVKVDGKDAVVVEKEGAPRLTLEPGDHVITGAFAWDTLPESLRIPADTGLVQLTLRGVPVSSVNRDAQGIVWLHKTRTAGEEGDALELVVHRKVTDAVPLLLTTRIELHVSGKNREIVTGRALPPGFVAMSLEAPLPARVEPDGRLRVQVRPGVFVIELVARSDGPVGTLSRPAPDGPWREGDEVWVFDARNDLRLVTVEGVTSIDPQQTTLPDAWKKLPAHGMKLGATMRLVERRRGDAEPPPDQLTLDRTLWLEFAGGGYTVKDRITGTLNRDSRLTMAAPTELGRAAIAGKDQFITRAAGSPSAGIEVRQGTLTVDADSWIPGDPRDLPAVGWAHDFHKVSAVLHLPPGWRLLHVSGADDASGTWVKHWSLLEIFLALVLAVAAGRLYGARWGVIAACAFLLTFPEDGAPRWTWAFVLGTEALFRVLPEPSTARRLFMGARLAAAVLVALLSLAFVVAHVREGLFPSLTNADAVVGSGGESIERSSSGLLDLGMRKSASPPVSVPAAEEDAKVDGDGAQDLRGEREGEEKAHAQSKAGSLRKVPSRYDAGRAKLQNPIEYDPQAIVQTGPGVPKWTWTTISLQWNGPVTRGQRLEVHLLSPRANLALALLRAVLLGILLARTLPFLAGRLPGAWGAPPVARVVVAALSMVALLAVEGRARAQVPDAKTLEELRERLSRKPECTPSCASSPRMILEAKGATLRARMEVDAIAPTAVPLPGSLAQWTPREVLLDGQPARGLARLETGALWLLLSPGNHQVVLEGELPDRETVQIALPLRPHRVEVSATGWTVEGVHEDGLADENLQLTRVRREGAGASLQPGVLPPFVRVERTLQIGLNWQVDTRVVRATPPGAAVVLEIPLLPGENVTTDLRVSGGKALVNMGPQVSEVTWHSVLEQRSPIRLAAPRSPSWTEIWNVDVGPIWHASYGGIPPIHAASGTSVRIPAFHPWPGEEVLVALDRPAGVPGQTLTIDDSVTAFRPGLRATDATLTATLRSSRGGEHTLLLPEGAVLETLTVAGRAQPLRQDGRKVTIPLVPGAQAVVATWRDPVGIGAFFRARTADLGAPSVNASTTLEVSQGRWLLLVGGPGAGPAVLFWSLLAILAVVALLLGRTTSTPLRSWHWLLLAIGLSQVSLVLGAVFVGWLFALGRRRKDTGDDGGRRWTFNLRQIGIVPLTVLALVVLMVAIHQGLLGAPEMQVRGNGSSPHLLRWYVDRSGPALAAPWIVSVPVLVYRGVMLTWALWTAFALLGWLRWGWTSFAMGGLWRKAPLPPVIPRPTPPPLPAEPRPGSEGM